MQEKNGVIAGQRRTTSSASDFSFAVKIQTAEAAWSPEAEAVLPEQFFRLSGESHAAWTGERRLLFAVLEEAVESFLRYRTATTRRGRRLFDETIEWFWGRDQRWLYSFETICQHLGLDAEYIREGLLRLSEMETEKKADASPTRVGKNLRQVNRPFAHAA